MSRAPEPVSQLAAPVVRFSMAEPPMTPAVAAALILLLRKAYRQRRTDS